MVSCRFSKYFVAIFLPEIVARYRVSLLTLCYR